MDLLGGRIMILQQVPRHMDGAQRAAAARGMALGGSPCPASPIKM